MEGREAKGGKKDLMLYLAVLFAAGTMLLTICLKMRLTKEWRAWVFLALNLILLGIVFTSAPSSSKENEENNIESAAIETETKGRGQPKEELAEEWHDCCGELYENGNGRDEPRPKGKEGGELPQMSMEELNERVEDFIAMFRQHLILDAKNSR